MRAQIESINKSCVAFIVPDIYPCATGGMEIFYFNLLKELKDKANILLITACKRYAEPGVEIVRVNKKFFGIPGSGRFFLPMKIFLTLINLKKKIKVIHFPYTSNAGKWGYVLSAAHKLLGIKYLMHVHGGGMRNWKYLSGNKSLFKNANELIAVSDLIKDEYEKRTGRNLKLIYPLVSFTRSSKSNDEIRSAKGFSESDKILLFVGSLKTIKAPDTLIKAFHKLGKEYIHRESLKLIFIGIGDLKTSVEKETTTFGLQDYVSFTGLIPYEEVPDYFKMADIYIMPSKFEGTPKSLLEAMFNKLPIIASDVTGINNVLADNVHALLFPSNNPAALCDKIRKLISDRQLCQKLSENAHKHYVEKYSFEKTVNDLLKTYENYE